MKIGIVTNLREKKGLWRDALILERLLLSWGHEVTLLDFRGIDRSLRFHLTIHLEMVLPKSLWWSDAHWWIPNPDWSSKTYLEYADAFRVVMAKTHEGKRVLTSAGVKRVTFTGFESDDNYNPEVPRERRFYHSWCGSLVKGTRTVTKAWGEGRGPYPATFVLGSRLGDLEHVYEQNRCQFWIQPSSVEGFGHCIHEGLGVGAVVATTAGPPMSEPGGTFLIPARKIARQNLADIYEVSAQAVRQTADILWNLSDEEVERASSRSREVFLAERDGFRERLKALL